MPRLHHRPGSRSTRVLWVLEEIGAPYDVTIVTDEFRRSPDHFAKHPLGRVPFMELDDGTVMFESLACCLYLADAHPDAGLLGGPSGSSERALAYQWSVFAMTEVEAPLIAVRTARDAGNDIAPALERINTAFGAVADALGDREWLVGDSFTVADAVMVSNLGLAHSRGMLEGFPALGAYVDRGHARPAYERAQGIAAPA
jgi:glutathione S-transferase